MTRPARLIWAVCLTLPACFANSSTRADGASIPIDRPVLITESGSYIVTADFTANTGNAIQLLGNIDVDIDFGGHTVRALAATVVLVQSGIDSAPFLTLHDGRVTGAGSGLSSPTNFGYGGRRVTIDIARMTFEDADVWLEDGPLTITSSRFVNSEMQVYSNRGGGIGLFENNEVSGADIIASGTTGSLIRHNSIQGGSILIGVGDSSFSGRAVIEENHIFDGSIRVHSPWFGGSGSAWQILVRRNVVSGSIQLGDSDEASIIENRVGGCSATGSAIAVGGLSRRGSFERNILTGACPYGITFDELTGGNLYRDNVMPRVTCAPVLDNGLDNTDGGGNKPTKAPLRNCPAAE